MKNLILIRHLISLRQSYWFIPMIMIIASIGLAALVVEVDRNFYLPETTLFSWINNLGPGGARAVFSTIAGSTITVAGTIFSIAMVVLVMASSQFGPRLIPTFMRVGKIQFGFGLFVGTFVYCLLMLTFVPAENKGELLPVWGVLVGVALGVLAFLVLIMLIHEIATFIQAPVITQRVSEDIIKTFERVFPEQDNDNSSERDGKTSFEAGTDTWPVTSTSKGYVATIDFEKLVEIGEQANAVLSLRIRPGEYVIENQVLALVDGSKGDREAFSASLCEAISLSPDRNLTQDARYAIDQMVEIAVRALSPGVNDPFTAVNCVDKLGSALAHLSQRRIALRLWRDEQGKVRLVTRPETYEEIVESAFGQIRHYAVNAPSVMLRLIESIGSLAKLELHPEMAQALYDQLLAMEDALTESLPFQRDRDRLTQRYKEVIAMFELKGDRVRVI